MADSNPSIVATPYPTYVTGGNDDGDDAFKAALIAHANGSVERNQDSQFAALRSQLVNRDVVDNARATENAKYELASVNKDAEIRSVERFAELKAELAALRAEGLQRDVAQLRAEMAETKADARSARTESLLETILSKLPA